MILGKVRVPQVSFPAWISHPQDPIQYSLDGYLDEVQVLNRSISSQQEEEDLSPVTKPAGEVIPYAVLPSGPAGPGPFGAMNASLQYSPAWDRLRRIGPDSDVVVRFDKSKMRLVFWQGTNYIPAWVTEDGKWYTDEFLETWGPGCGGSGDCEPMSDKQSRYSHVNVLESTECERWAGSVGSNCLRSRSARVFGPGIEKQPATRSADDPNLQFCGAPSG